MKGIYAAIKWFTRKITNWAIGYVFATILLILWIITFVEYPQFRMVHYAITEVSAETLHTGFHYVSGYPQVVANSTSG